MPGKIVVDPKQVLKTAKTILLVDWPNPNIPRELLYAGFTVFGYSPNHYSAAELIIERPDDVSAKNIFPPTKNDDKGYLVFHKIEGDPGSVDIVNIFRPDEELEEIINAHVLPLAAKTIWMQPPATSSLAVDLSVKYGLTLIENSDIAEIAHSLGKANRNL